MKKRFTVAITGGSGAVYAVRLIEVLLAVGHDVHLSISPSGAEVLKQELDIKVNLDKFKQNSLMLGGADPSDSKLAILKASAGTSSSDSNVLGVSQEESGGLHYHHYQDYLAPIASGTFPCDGMIVCPCSGSTLAAIAHGLSGNLIQRAGEVHLKEQRTLVLVPREAPLSLPAIENMRRAKLAGAVILPASPGWYHGVKSLRDIVDFIVNRICDQIGVKVALISHWGSDAE